MESIIRKGVLHAVAAYDLRHVVEGIVSVRYIAKLNTAGILTRHLSRSAGFIILVCSLIAETVGHFRIAGGFAVYSVLGLIAPCIGLANQVVACIVTGQLTVVFVESEGTVDCTEFTVCKGGFGKCIAEHIGCLVKDRSIISCSILASLISSVCSGTFDYEIACRKIGLDTVPYQLNVVKVSRTAVIAVITVYGNILNSAELLLCKLY